MDDVVEPKQTLTPRAAVPICTLMSDGAIQVEQDQLPLLELQRMLLSAAANITVRTVQRASAMERVLASINARFDGFGAETERAIAEVLNPVPPAREA